MIICYSVTLERRSEGKLYKFYQLAMDGSEKQRMIKRMHPWNLYQEWTLPERSNHFHCRPKLDSLDWHREVLDAGH